MWATIVGIEPLRALVQPNEVNNLILTQTKPSKALKISRVSLIRQGDSEGPGHRRKGRLNVKEKHNKATGINNRKVKVGPSQEVGKGSGPTIAATAKTGPWKPDP